MSLLIFLIISRQSYKLVNKQLLLDWDIPAVNGIIHVLEAPLTAPHLPVSEDGLTQSCWQVGQQLNSVAGVRRKTLHTGIKDNSQKS